MSYEIKLFIVAVLIHNIQVLIQNVSENELLIIY